MSDPTNKPNLRFRFSDRMTLVTEPNHDVVVNNMPLSQDTEKSRQLDLEAEREKAYRQGWADCEKETTQKLNALMTKMQQERTALPQALNAYLEELENQFRGEVVDLSFQIAECLLERGFAQRDEYERVLLRVMETVSPVSSLKLSVTPELAGAIAKGEIRLRPGVEIIGDPALKSGEVRVSSSHGIIDGTFQSRLACLREELEKNAGQIDSGENT